jgi:PCRF domain
VVPFLLMLLSRLRTAACFSNSTVKLFSAELWRPISCLYSLRSCQAPCVVVTGAPGWQRAVLGQPQGAWPLCAPTQLPSRLTVRCRATDRGVVDTVAAVRRVLEPLQVRVEEAHRLADVDSTRARLATLQHDAAADDVWDNPTRGQALATEISSLKEELATLDGCAWRAGQLLLLRDTVPHYVLTMRNTSYHPRGSSKSPRPHSFTSLLEDASFALELAELETAGRGSSSSGGSAAAAGGVAVNDEQHAQAELASMLAEARSSLGQLSAALDRYELRMLLSGQYDEAGALLTITAGAGVVSALRACPPACLPACLAAQRGTEQQRHAPCAHCPVLSLIHSHSAKRTCLHPPPNAAGGVDAMDWAAMLERMYMRWAADHGYSVTVRGACRAL